mgnify:CR=1 FL=1
MQKSEFIAKIKTLAKTVYAEKSNPLADAEEIQDQVEEFKKSFMEAQSE